MKSKYYLKDKKISIYQEEEISEPGEAPELRNVLVRGSAWAYVRQLSQRELYEAKAVGATEEMLFVINYLEGISVPNCNIVYNGRKYNVTLIDTFEGYRRDLTLYTSGGQTDDISGNA